MGEGRAEPRTAYAVLGAGERPSGAKAQRPLEFKKGFTKIEPRQNYNFLHSGAMCFFDFNGTALNSILSVSKIKTPFAKLPLTTPGP